MSNTVRCVRWLLVALLAFAPQLSFAQTATFNLPAQPLAESLKTIGAQANVNVMVAPALVDGKRAPALKAQLSVSEALTRLLDGTGLEYHFVNDQTVVIRQKRAATPASQESLAGQVTRTDARDPTQEAGKQSSQDFRVAQADQGAASQSLALGSNPSSGGSNLQNVRLEEIVVTAQKREERLKDVPISIVAITAAELNGRNIQNLDDLTGVVPGLSITDAAGSRRVFLRGISNIFGGTSALIGMYLDEASVTSSSAAQLDLRTYDLERVEVLRGPQGTLYGEGSVGGTIRFITKNPRLNQFAMNADVTASFTQDGAPTQRVESVVNVPLIDDQLAIRVVGTFDHEGGWIDQPAANLKNFNNQNVTDVRIKALWQPLAQFSANAMAVIHRNDGVQNPGEDADQNYTQAFNLTTTPAMEDDYDIFNLTLSYDFDWARLLSTTSYIKQDQYNRNVGGSAQYYPPDQYPRNEFYSPDSQTRTRNLNQELRLTSNGSGPWNWTLGGFYRHFRTGVDTPATYYGFAAPPGTPLPAPYSLQNTNLSESGSAFADTNYRLFGRLTVGAGVRYFMDRQDAASGVAAPLGPTQTGKFHSLDPRFYLGYKLSDAVNAYGSAAKGFRSGGFNLLNQPRFDPENVWTYELGSKVSTLGNRLSVNADLFFSRYEGYQITGVLPPPELPLNIYRNAGDAQIKGAELDVTWRPAEAWVLNLSGDYLHTRFTTVNVLSAAYVVADPLDFIPKYQYTASVQRDLRWMGKPAFARLDYSETGRETYRIRSLGPQYYGESDVIHLLSFNSTLDWSDHLSLGFFAQNLLNTNANTYPAYIDGGGAVRPRPRTFGVRFATRFD